LVRAAAGDDRALVHRRDAARILVSLESRLWIRVDVLVLPAPPRARCSEPIALLAAFAVSGLVFHDLPVWPSVAATTHRTPVPFMTIAFVPVGAIVLVSDRARVDIRTWTVVGRILFHLACLAGAVSGAGAVLHAFQQ
jgi:hypothetical protein